MSDIRAFLVFTCNEAASNGLRADDEQTKSRLWVGGWAYENQAIHEKEVISQYEIHRMWGVSTIEWFSCAYSSYKCFEKQAELVDFSSG